MPVATVMTVLEADSGSDNASPVHVVKQSSDTFTIVTAHPAQMSFLEWLQ